MTVPKPVSVTAKKVRQNLLGRTHIFTAEVTLDDGQVVKIEKLVIPTTLLLRSGRPYLEIAQRCALDEVRRHIAKHYGQES